MMKENHAVARTGATVGALMVGWFERKVKGICHLYNVELEMEKDRGFLDTDFRITMSGPESNVRAAIIALKQLESEMS